MDKVTVSKQEEKEEEKKSGRMSLGASAQRRVKVQFGLGKEAQLFVVSVAVSLEDGEKGRLLFAEVEELVRKVEEKVGMPRNRFMLMVVLSGVPLALQTNQQFVNAMQLAAETQADLKVFGNVLVENGQNQEIQQLKGQIAQLKSQLEEIRAGRFEERSPLEYSSEEKSLGICSELEESLELLRQEGFNNKELNSILLEKNARNVDAVRERLSYWSKFFNQEQ